MGADFDAERLVNGDEVGEEVGNGVGVGDADGVGKLEVLDAIFNQAIDPFLDDFDVPRVAVGIAEAHGNIDEHFFVVPEAKFLDLGDAVEGFFDGGVGIAHLEGFGNGKGVAQIGDFVELDGVFGAPSVGDDTEEFAFGGAQVELADDLCRVAHLGDGFGGNKTAEVYCIEADFEQGIDIPDFGFGGYEGF